MCFFHRKNCLHFIISHFVLPLRFVLLPRFLRFLVLVSIVLFCPLSWILLYVLSSSSRLFFRLFILFIYLFIPTFSPSDPSRCLYPRVIVTAFAFISLSRLCSCPCSHVLLTTIALGFFLVSFNSHPRHYPCPQSLVTELYLVLLSLFLSLALPNGSCHSPYLLQSHPCLCPCFHMLVAVLDLTHLSLSLHSHPYSCTCAHTFIGFFAPYPRRCRCTLSNFCCSWIPALVLFFVLTPLSLTLHKRPSCYLWIHTFVAI